MHSIVVKHQRNLIMKEVKEVLRRTVGSDSRFNILSGSHLKSQGRWKFKRNWKFHGC